MLKMTYEFMIGKLFECLHILPFRVNKIGEPKKCVEVYAIGGLFV